MFVKTEQEEDFLIKNAREKLVQDSLIWLGIKIKTFCNELPWLGIELDRSSRDNLFGFYYYYKNDYFIYNIKIKSNAGSSDLNFAVGNVGSYKDAKLMAEFMFMNFINHTVMATVKNQINNIGKEIGKMDMVTKYMEELGLTEEEAERAVEQDFFYGGENE